MSRKHKHDGEEPRKIPQATRWIWALILSILAGGASYSYQVSPSLGLGTLTSSPVVNSTSTISMTLATSTIQFGVSAPKGDRDQLYVLSLPSKSVEVKTVQKGWRVDALKTTQTLHIVPASPDGEPPILTDGGDWNIPLRSANGEAYLEPRIAGYPDKLHVYVMARTDVNKLLLVSRTGEIRSLYDVPENAMPLPSSDDHAWFVTFIPGEGIESDPVGPSKLIRVSLSGIQDTIAEDSHLVTSVAPGLNGALAYRTDNGDTVVTGSGKRWNGNGVPLLWLDEHRVLVAQGLGVFLLDMRTLSFDLLVELPAAPSVASVL